ncbi:MAG: hypothetical protein HY291_18100 [Planctomycetes bacterium]|nr:hypothetical protein [Planctomycetota bacterium]
MFGYRSANRGFSIGKVFVLILPAILFWAAGDMLYVYFTNPQMVETSLADFNAGKTGAAWVKLTDCSVFVPGAVLIEQEHSQEIDKVYLPLRPASDPGAPLAHVLLETRDPELVALVQDLDKRNPAEVAQYINEHREKFQFERVFQGLVRVGMDSGPSDREKVAKASGKLTPEFLIVQDGKEPMLGLPLFLIGIGLAFLYVMLVGVPARSVKAGPRGLQVGSLVR